MTAARCVGVSSPIVRPARWTMRVGRLDQRARCLLVVEGEEDALPLRRLERGKEGVGGADDARGGGLRLHSRSRCAEHGERREHEPSHGLSHHPDVPVYWSGFRGARRVKDAVALRGLPDAARPRWAAPRDHRRGGDSMRRTLTSLLHSGCRRSHHGAIALASGVAMLAVAASASAQGAPTKPPPVIDIHVHTFGGGPGLPPMCPFPPQFLASDPKTKEGTIGWSDQNCVLPLKGAATPDDYMKEVLADYERLNVTAVVMGDEASVKKWKAAAPGRIIMGTSFTNGIGTGNYESLDKLRAAYTTGGFKVMGEIGLQYEGISPSDMSVDKYFALAEELDIPVGIHMGTGGSGRANIGSPKFRGSMGNPLLLEDLLARHPKLRVWVMHAGYPMIDNMLTLLQANSHVYVDVAGLIWSYPRKEVDTYIQRLVEAGFEDRVMFGTDQLVWPKLMELLDRGDRSRELSHAAAEARHPLQQRGALPETRQIDDDFIQRRRR